MVGITITNPSEFCFFILFQYLLIYLIMRLLYKYKTLIIYKYDSVIWNTT
jgi:hypothetical protein